MADTSQGGIHHLYARDAMKVLLQGKSVEDLDSTFIKALCSKCHDIADQMCIDRARRTALWLERKKKEEAEEEARENEYFSKKGIRTPAADEDLFG